MKRHSFSLILSAILLLSGTAYAASDPEFFRSGVGGNAYYAPVGGFAVKIDEFGICRNVKDQASNDLLIPVNTFGEWGSFINNVRSEVAQLTLCSAAPVLGCTNPSATNYNPAATQDDGSCVPPISGCTNSGYANYNPAATVDDGSCSNGGGGGGGSCETVCGAWGLDCWCAVYSFYASCEIETCSWTCEFYTDLCD